MSEPLRIFLRLLGLVLLASSLAAVALIIAVGPDEVAEHMGRSCSSGRNHREYWCTWHDALGIMEMLPYTALVGGVLLLVLGRREKQATATIDLSGSGRSRFPVGALGPVAVVLLVAATFPVVFLYRHGYTAVHVVQVTKKIQREAERTDFTGKGTPAAPRAAKAPRGLAAGSLLRTARFRAAMGEIRRAAPAGGRISGLRVAADHIDAEVLAGGRTTTVRRTWNARAAVVSTAPTLDGEVPLVAFGRLDPRAPQRIARAAGEDVDYLVLQDFGGLRWRAFRTGGKGQLTRGLDGRR